MRVGGVGEREEKIRPEQREGRREDEVERPDERTGSERRNIREKSKFEYRLNFGQKYNYVTCPQKMKSISSSCIVCYD